MRYFLPGYQKADFQVSFWTILHRGTDLSLPQNNEPLPVGLGSLFINVKVLDDNIRDI